MHDREVGEKLLCDEGANDIAPGETLKQPEIYEYDDDLWSGRLGGWWGKNVV